MKHTLELQLAIHFTGTDPEALQKEIDETVEGIQHLLGMPRVKQGSRTWWFTLEKLKEGGKLVRKFDYKRPSGT